MIAHPVILDVSRELARQVAWLLQSERRRGTRGGTRVLTCFWQAVLGLRWFRHRADPERLGRDHRLSRATAYRYLDDVIDVLADQAPDLHQAVKQAHEHDMAYVILDGTVITTDRVGEKTTSVPGKTIDLWYSGKAGEHGGNIQALSAPNGFPLCGSDVEPGSTHALTAAREHALGALYAAASRGLPTLADGGYEGTGIGVHTPIKQPPGNQALDADNRTYNALLRGLRSLGERGFALLTGRWRTLQRITASPSKIGSIIQAAVALPHLEHRRPETR
ncbi:HARBI1 family protein [Actinopolyspora halophila]|uniref:transposase family protein n=1 Tax=Actinopolyspora halophila TaxID=1850 RepID=UPI000686C896